MRTESRRATAYLCAALAIGLAVVAHLMGAQAQSSKAALTSQINSCFPDQTTGQITPAGTRLCLTNIVNSFQQYASVNAQAGTTYTVQTSDYGQLVTFSNANPVAVTLPQAAGSFATFSFFAKNLGAGTVTITPQGGSTINGSSTLTIATNSGEFVVSDGVNYQAIALSAGAGAVSSVSNSDGTVVVSPTTGAVVVSLAIASKPGVICGKKTNYVIQPYTPGASPQTVVAINNLNNIQLCLGQNYVSFTGPFTPFATVTVANFQESGFAGCSAASTCQAAADITAGAIGPGTTNSRGGLDTGTVAANTQYCLWLVSNGTLAGTGMVWSARCDPNGPFNPVAASYPYYAYMGWNVTNGSCPGAGCGLVYSLLVTTDGWTYYTGGSGTGGAGTGVLPTIFTGTQAQWTSFNGQNDRTPPVVSPHADAYLLSLVNGTGAAHVAVAPNTSFGPNPVCDNQVSGMTVSCGPISTDRGQIGVWSTDANAKFRLIAFHDGNI